MILLHTMVRENSCVLHHGVEQLVAHQTHNLKVGGSSPPSVTISKSFLRLEDSSFYFLSIEGQRAAMQVVPSFYFRTMSR